eukprot:scaffold3100_cov110-Isochrysis_galbana.AAC.5
MGKRVWRMGWHSKGFLRHAQAVAQAVEQSAAGCNSCVWPAIRPAWARNERLADLAVPRSPPSPHPDTSPYPHTHRLDTHDATGSGSGWGGRRTPESAGWGA